MCRIEELGDLSKDASSDVINDRRERYARAALTMFHPFRRNDELCENVIRDNKPEFLYWPRFVDALKNCTLWPKGIEILHNIDDRKTAMTMKLAANPLTKLTELRKKEHNDEDDDPRDKTVEDEEKHAIDLSMFDIQANEHEASYDILEGYSNLTQRSHSHLIGQDINSDRVIGARIGSNQRNLLIGDLESSEFTMEMNTECNPITEYEESQNMDQDRPTLVQFINGALVGGSYDELYCNFNDSDTYRQDEEGETDNTGIFDDLFDTRRDSRIPTLVDIARRMASEGTKLDEKQYAAYEIIACSFLLSVLDNMDSTSNPFQSMDMDSCDVLRSRLKGRGGKEHLVFFLTGVAGAGKSSCIKAAQRFCYEFCRVASVPWDANAFLFTSTTGSSASLFEGQTIHDAAFLNGKTKNISEEKKRQWQKVRVLIIDEISFFTRNNLEKLDLRLKNIMGRNDIPFGGINTVFSGDFHQLHPVGCEKDGILYEGVKNGLFEGSINPSISLEISHRFDEDPEYGELLRRLRNGEITKADIDLLNTRVVGRNGLRLPTTDEESDIAYACPFNKQRNSIAASIFKDHLCNSGEFPDIRDDALPPMHTIIVEEDIQSMNSCDK
jgi:hypothetical protein